LKGKRGIETRRATESHGVSFEGKKRWRVEGYAMRPLAA